jgi:glycosyltransferase involved in cell wall biosynthesis
LPLSGGSAHPRPPGPAAHLITTPRLVGGRIGQAVGFVERETVAFYRAADLLAYPSHNETFGLPILEAMAGDCPLVTSQVSSMPEIAGGAAIPPIPPPSPGPWWPR